MNRNQVPSTKSANRRAWGRKFPMHRASPLRSLKTSVSDLSIGILIYLGMVMLLFSAYQTLLDSIGRSHTVGHDRTARRVEKPTPDRADKSERDDSLEEELGDAQDDEEELEVEPELVEEDEQKFASKWSWEDDANYDLNALWHGRGTRSTFANSFDHQDWLIHGVLSHCLGDLSWLPRYLIGLRLQSFTLVSKCGVNPNSSHLPDGTRVLKMENVGRIDHTIAHWMAQVVPSTYYDNNTNGNQIYLFLKDNINVHCEGSMKNATTLIHHTAIDGFGCALEPRAGKSFFHLTGMLKTFSMENYSGVVGVQNSPIGDTHDVVFKSIYKNMGHWLRAMGVSLPEPLTPVCYGGNFAVKRSHIEQVPHKIRLKLERSLSRGDSIEEGHFSERTWAGLLYRALTEDEIELLFQRTNNLAYLPDAMRGALMKG